MKKENKAVSLPAKLYNDIEQRIGDTEFGSVDEYVTFVLEEVLKEEEGEEESVFSEEEEAEVKKRLKALGYLE